MHSQCVEELEYAYSDGGTLRVLMDCIEQVVQTEE